MKRCDPAQMRKTLVLVEAYKQAGVDFVPVPVKNPVHRDALVSQVDSILEELLQIEESK